MGLHPPAASGSAQSPSAAAARQSRVYTEQLLQRLTQKANYFTMITYLFTLTLNMFTWGYSTKNI